MKRLWNKICATFLWLVNGSGRALAVDPVEDDGCGGGMQLDRKESLDEVRSQWKALGLVLAVAAAAVGLLPTVAAATEPTISVSNDVSLYYFVGRSTLYKVSPFRPQQEVYRKLGTNTYGKASEYFDALFVDPDMGRPWTWRVRGIDMVEDNHFQFRGSKALNYFEITDGSGAQKTVTAPEWAYNLHDGPLSGWATYGNDRLLAVSDDGTIWLKPDDAPAHYSRGGVLVANQRWTNGLTGGPLDGLSLEEACKYLIGCENGPFYFMTNDTTVVGYRGASGLYDGTISGEWLFPTNSDLAGLTLGEIIDGKAPGYFYLGWSEGGPVIMKGTAFNPPSFRHPGRDGTLLTEDDLLISSPTATLETNQFGYLTFPEDGMARDATGVRITDNDGDPVPEGSLITDEGTIFLPDANGNTPPVNSHGVVTIPRGGSYIFWDASQKKWIEKTLVNGGESVPGIGLVANGEIWYVDWSKPDDSHTGLGSWDNAKKTLQAVVSLANDGDTIYVRKGTYPPIASSNKTLQIYAVDSVEETIIDGGWDRVNGSSVGERAAMLGVSTQSPTMWTNTVLHGFTLRNGNTGESGDRETLWGGGALGGTLVGCVIRDCFAIYGGGASGSLLIDCTLSNNYAHCGGGVSDAKVIRSDLYNNGAQYGGGAHSSEMLFCDIRDNFAMTSGGGYAYREADGFTFANTSLVQNCRIYGNWTSDTNTTGRGGGVSRGVVHNSLIYDNSSGCGGGVASAWIYNCTVSGNRAAWWGGGMFDENNHTARAYNSIISGNTSDQGGSVAEIYGMSDTNATYVGEDAGFVDMANQDFRLASTSVCIAAGSTNFLPVTQYGDIEGNPRTTVSNHVETINQGAYEMSGGSYIRLPGADETPGNADDLLLLPGLGEREEVVPDTNGYYTILHNTTALDNQENVITNKAGEKVPEGSLVVDDSIILLPGEDGVAPSVDKRGVVTIPAGGSAIVWDVGAQRWIELELPGGGSYAPGTGLEPGGPAVEEDGGIVLPGKDGVLYTEDDVRMDPPATGDVEEDEFGNYTIPETGIVKDATGNPIVGNTSNAVPTDAVLTGDYTFILPNDLGEAPVINTNDGSITIPEDGSIIVWDDSGKRWMEIELPGGGTYEPGTGVKPNGPGLDDVTILSGRDGILFTEDDIRIPAPSTGSLVPDANGYITVPETGIVQDAGRELILDKRSNAVPAGAVITDDNTILLPDTNGVPPAIETDGTVTIPQGGSMLRWDVDEEAWVEFEMPGGGVYVPGSGVMPDGMTVDPDDYFSLPGSDGKIHTADDIRLIPPTTGTILADTNGYITVPETGIVRDARRDPITDYDGNGIPEGAVIVEDGIILMPGTNNVPPTIETDGSVTIPSGGSVIAWDEGAHRWRELSLPDGGAYVPGEGIEPNGPAVNESGTYLHPGKDKVVNTEDDIQIDPPLTGEVVPDDNGYITVPETGGVKDGNGDPITDKDDNPVPEGSVITDDGTIVLPGTNDVPPAIETDGTVTIPEGGSTLTWDDQEKEWQETEFPGGGTVDPETGIIPNGPAVTEDGTVVHPGKDELLNTDDDISIDPPASGEVVPDDNGYITVPETGGVKDHNGDPITDKNDDPVQEGSVIMDDGTIVLPGTNDVPPAIETDGTVTIPEGGSTLTWNDQEKEWQETEFPGGGTIDPETGIIPNGPVVIEDGTVVHPGKDELLNTDDDILIDPTPEGPVVPDGNGYITVPETGGVKDGNGDPITDKDDNPVPEGSVITDDGTIVLPGTDNVPPAIGPDGTVTIPEGGSTLTWDDQEKEWQETEYPGGGTVDPETGIIPNGPAVTEDGTVIHPGKDGIMDTEDDILIDPPATGEVVPDDNGYITVPETGGVKDGNGDPITDKNDNPVPEGSVITDDGTIVLPGTNDVPPAIGPDGNVTIPEGGSTLTWDDQEKEWQETEYPGGGTVDPGTGIIPNGPAVEEDGTVIHPGKDGYIDTDDDIRIDPPASGEVVPDDNGYITVPETGGVKDGNGDPITDKDDNPVPEGSVITDDGTIILPGTNDVPPAIGPDGTVTIPEGGSTLTWDDQEKEWQETEFPGGGTVDPETGITPNGPAVTEDGTVIHPGKDELLNTDDDIRIDPPASGEVVPDDNGYITVPETGGVKDHNGDPITDKDDNPVPEGSVITDDGTIVLPGTDDVPPTIEPDGTVTIPDGGSTLTWNDQEKEWQETEFPGGGTIGPEGGIIPNGPAVTDDGTVVHPGKDELLNTDDDILIDPPASGEVVPDDNGYITVPETGGVKDPNGDPITDKDDNPVPEGSVITDDGTIILPGTNDVPPAIGPDGNVTIPEGGSTLTWDDQEKEWQETEYPGGGTVDPDTGILPNGPAVEEDGTVVHPGKDELLNTDDDIRIDPPASGEVVPDDNGYITVPETGGVKDHNGNPIQNNDGGDVPAGSIITGEGTILLPNGNGDFPVVGPDGSVDIPEDGSIIIWDDSQKGWVEVKIPEGGRLDPTQEFIIIGILLEDIYVSPTELTVELTWTPPATLDSYILYTSTNLEEGVWTPWTATELPALGNLRSGRVIVPADITPDMRFFALQARIQL